MKILASGWLQRMVEKAGATPQARILALFGILQDWVEAPGMLHLLQDEPLTEAGRSELQAYLARLAAEAGVSDAEALSNQLVCLLLGALRQELRAPGCAAIRQAGQAAEALLAGRRRPPRVPSGSVRLAAPALAAAFVAALLLPHFAAAPERQTPFPRLSPAAASRPAGLNPDRLAAVYHLHDAIRSAQCGYPQALMLPPEQRAIYLENVVAGSGDNLSPRTLELVSQLYRKVDCYYPPAALM